VTGVGVVVGKLAVAGTRKLADVISALGNTIDDIALATRIDIPRPNVPEVNATRSRNGGTQTGAADGKLGGFTRGGVPEAVADLTNIKVSDLEIIELPG
jgi:hypothetical protein